MSACLGNCSNQGICVLNVYTQEYTCECNQYRTGKACQTDSRPCSSSPCLNNGTCSNTNNETSFQCICQNPNLFFGSYCENRIDLCFNNTEVCIKGQGYCVLNNTQSQPMCKCLKGYSGPKCEIMSTSLAVTKIIINASSIIAIVVLVSLIILVLCFDYTKYFAMKNRNVIKNKQEIKRLYYTP